MKFYEAVLSSAAFRVRIALNLKGLAYESVVFDLRANQHLTEEYRRVNPMRSVPALELAPGQFLFESMAIVEYLDETHPEPPLLPKEPLARSRVRAIAQLVACDIHPLNNLRVLLYLGKTLGQSQAARDEWARHWITAGFAAIEAMLGDTRSGRFCHGDTPGLADICLVPQVFNARRPGIDTPLAPYPRLMKVHEACMALPAFADADPAKQPDAEP